MTECKLMAHLVAGYPDQATSLDIALALIAGGADYLEVQFPFSDPSADGPVIERACHASLAAGFTSDKGFALLRELSARAAGTPLFIMTYASVVYARGVRRFAEDAAAAGAAGLIVPDFPPDGDEGLYAAGRAAGLAVVPVLAPGISDARLAMMAEVGAEYVYTALRAGITGKETVLGAEGLAYLDRLAVLRSNIIAGFGIRRREQLQALAGHVHAAAVGSYFLDAMAGGGDPAAAVRKACAALLAR